MPEFAAVKRTLLAKAFYRKREFVPRSFCLTTASECASLACKAYYEARKLGVGKGREDGPAKTECREHCQS